MMFGTCGKNLRWELNGDTLIISGTGEMENYQCGIRSRTAPAPWFDLSGSTKKIIVNDGVTTIGNSAFYNFTKVTDVKIPNSLTKIGDGAFFYCWSLKEIQLSDSVLKIGNRAFGSCWALMYVTIPNSVVHIDDWAFSSCESLKSATIPANVLKVGESVFATCLSLKEIHYPAGRGFEKNLSQGNNAKLIPYNVAPPVNKPTPQPVKPTTQTVDATKFYPVQPTKQQPKFYPVQSTTKTVAEKLTWSFEGKTLTVGGVRVIENFPYAQIPWLKHLHDIQRIIIGNGVEKISPHAFDDCTRLEILELPASVKTIGDMAFSVSFCGSINGIKNVFWCLEDGVLVLKKNPDVSPAADFSTGSISWIFAEKNIRSIKIEDGVKPTGKFFEWMVQRFNGKEISFGE